MLRADLTVDNEQFSLNTKLEIQKKLGFLLVDLRNYLQDSQNLISRKQDSEFWAITWTYMSILTKLVFNSNTSSITYLKDIIFVLWETLKYDCFKQFSEELFWIIVQYLKFEAQLFKQWWWKYWLKKTFQAIQDALQELVISTWKYPQFQDRILELILNKNLFWIKDKQSWLFEYDLFRYTGKNSDSNLGFPENLVNWIKNSYLSIMSWFDTWNTIVGENEYITKKRDLLTRRANLLYYLWISLLESWNTNKALEVFREFFRLNNKNISKFSYIHLDFKIDELNNHVINNKEVFNLFLTQINKIPDSWDKNNALFSLMRKHFEIHDNPIVILEYLESLKNIKVKHSFFEFINEFVKKSSNSENIEEVIFRLTIIFDRIESGKDFIADILINMWDTLKNWMTDNLANICYRKSLSIAIHLPDRIKYLYILPLAARKVEWLRLDKSLVNCENVVNTFRVEMWGYNDTDKNISEMSYQYARLGNYNKIDDLLNLTKKKINYPEESIREILVSTIIWAVEVNNYNEIHNLIVKIPSGSRTNVFTSIIWKMLNIWKYKEALELTMNYKTFCNTKTIPDWIIPDNKCSLLVDILECADENGDDEFIEQISPLLFDYQFNEYSLKQVFKIYQKRILDDEFIIKLLKYATTNYDSMTWAYYKVLLWIIAELNSPHLSREMNSLLPLNIL